MGVAGALFGFLGVALGAFGAHGLRGMVSPEALETFGTGARYQLIHALALLFVAARARSVATASLRVAGWAFSLGILLFSGSLYTLVLLDLPGLGAITPFGGVAFLVGWMALGWSFVKEES